MFHIVGFHDSGQRCRRFEWVDYSSGGPVLESDIDTLEDLRQRMMAFSYFSGSIFDIIEVKMHSLQFVFEMGGKLSTEQARECWEFELVGGLSRVPHASMSYAIEAS
jgi:hypothetical protein